MIDKLTVRLMGPGSCSCHLSNGTNWPLPDVGEHEESLEWTLRYGSIEACEAIRLQVASIIGAYTALIYKPAKERNDVVRCLRTAAEQVRKET